MLLLNLFVKTLSKAARFLGRGGETWPGEIALKLNSQLGSSLKKRFSRIILVAGTNGKTSTAKFLTDALREAGETVIANRTGANLLNGLVSSALTQLPVIPKGKKPVAVFEVDEYALPEVAVFFRPEVILFLNIFRDQLDRYGEVNNILERWKTGLLLLKETKLVYLASDPALYYAFKSLINPKLPFVIPESYLAHKATAVFGDLIYCPLCGTKLSYSGYYLGHLGTWECQKCRIKIPKPAFKLEGTVTKLESLPSYQQINLLGAYTLLRSLNYPDKVFLSALEQWQPAFGRGEVFKQGSREYTFYLGKNPASWTAALKEINKTNSTGGVLVLGLNNRVPDGHDVSWIYDAVVQIEPKQFKKILFFGDRAYDLAVRFKLLGIKSDRVYTSVEEIQKYLERNQVQKVTVLANYSALLEIRRYITGRAMI